MATVRVRCAVGRQLCGDYVVLSAAWLTEETRQQFEHWYDASFVQWITVEIPLPVEPVVVAEVEASD